jgi:hypothetical protein
MSKPQGIPSGFKIQIACPLLYCPLLQFLGLGKDIPSTNLRALRASFSCVSKKAATEIRDKIKLCDFFTTRFAGVHGVHGDKRFVFAHVFLQEGTEGTEKLCQDYDYDAYGI